MLQVTSWTYRSPINRSVFKYHQAKLISTNILPSCELWLIGTTWQTTLLMLLQLKHSGVVWQTLCPVHRSAAHSPHCVYTTCWSCSVFQQMQMQMMSGYQKWHRKSTLFLATFERNLPSLPYVPRRLEWEMAWWLRQFICCWFLLLFSAVSSLVVPAFLLLSKI